MGELLLAATMLGAVPLQQTVSRGPAAVVRQALDAVEADSVDVAQRAWTRALEGDPADRLAALGLATLANYTYDDSSAERLYRAAAAGRSDVVAGHAAIGLARLGIYRSRWPFADSVAGLAVDAARAASDPALLAEALVVQANARTVTADPAAALAILDQADAIVPESDLVGRATAHCVRARAIAATGDTPGALDEALAGAALADRAGNARIRGDCEFVAGDNYSRMFRTDSALAAYGRAIDSFRLARERGGLAAALYHRADLRRILGRLGLARRDAVEAASAARTAGSRITEGWANVVMGQIAMSLHDMRGTAMHAAEVRRLFTESDHAAGQVMAAAFEANIAIRARDIPGSRAAFTALRDEAERYGMPDWLTPAWSGLAWVALLEGDSTAARAAVDAASAVIESLGLGAHGASMSYLEARLALHWGRLEEAERLYRSRLAADVERTGRRGYGNAARLAETLMLQGRLDEAERELRDAAATLDAWRESITDGQLRRLAYQASSDLADPDLGTASVIAALAADGRVESAFELVERGRARELTDRLNRAMALDTSEDPVARRSRPIGLDSVQRMLPDDSTAIFEYMTGIGDPTTLLVVTRTAARAYVLPMRDSLERPIARFAALVEAGGDPRPPGTVLGASLLGPALADLDPAVRRIIVVPDGPLHQLPFDVLVLPDGGFAVERFAIASAPAATVAALLRARPQTGEPASIAVIADPAFGAEMDEAQGEADIFRSAVSNGGGLPRLEGSGREASAVARYADNATIRRRGDASEAWLKSAALGGFDVVHFATHALVDGASITNTALALAPADGEDGFVRPGELANLSLDAELVVLSACRTAGGPIVRGEGVQGLAAPMLEAGARAVAVTWWPIGDVATIRMVDDFYAAMAAGQPVVDALRTAKLAALERGAPASEWAAFTIVGDPFARPLLRTPHAGFSVPVRLALPLVVALMVYLVVTRRRRMSEGRVPPGTSARTHQR